MNCQVFRNKQTNEIEEVLAPNGQESILFKDLLAEYKDKEVALQKWATTYTPSFKADYNGNYDVNGEVQITEEVRNSLMTDVVSVEVMLLNIDELVEGINYLGYVLDSEELQRDTILKKYPEYKELEDKMFLISDKLSELEEKDEDAADKMYNKEYLPAEKLVEEKYAEVLKKELAYTTQEIKNYNQEIKDTFTSFVGDKIEDINSLIDLIKSQDTDNIELAKQIILGLMGDSYSPKTMSETETKDLSTKIQELDTSFPGLSHLQVGQAISMLVNEVSSKAIDKEGLLEKLILKNNWKSKSREEVYSLLNESLSYSNVVEGEEGYYGLIKNSKEWILLDKTRGGELSMLYSQPFKGANSRISNVSVPILLGKVDIEIALQELANDFTDYLVALKAIDLEKVPKKAKSIVALIANYENTLSNFEELAAFATKVLSEDDKFKLDIEEVTDDKGEVYDIAVYEIDPKSGITPTMKRVLGGFTKDKVNYLGKPEYVSFEEAFNTIAAIVADKQHNMEEVLKSLEQHTEARPWLSQAIKRLKSLDKQLQNQFLSRMVMSKLDMKYVTLVQDGDVIKLNVINTNRNDIGTVIHGNWMQNIKTTSIMRAFEGTYKVRKDTFQELKEIYDKEEHTIDDFNTIMLTLGVNLSPLTLEKIAQYGVDGKPLEKLFTEREGLVNILMTELSGMISADKTLADVNPLSQGIVSKLAYFEARFNTSSYLTPNTFRSEEKQLYGYTMHCMLTDRVKNLLNGKMVSDLQSASFTKHSYYLSLLDSSNKTQTAINFRNRFKVFDSDLKAFEVNMPGNKQKAEGFTSLAEAEHELTKIAYFMDNNSKVKDGMRTAKYILPTMSDKTRVMGMEGLAFDLTGKNIPELVYDRVVYPEIDRILTHSAKDIKSYNDGARLIMFLPELNSVEINEDGVTVFEYLNEMKNIAQTDAGKELIKEKLLPKIQEYIDALIAEKISTFKRLEITDKIPKQKRFVEEYVINNLINITEAYQLFIGDPAMFYKTTVLKDIMKYDTLSKEDKVKIAEETFINVGKRLAMQIAPGTKLADSEKNHYYQIMLKDRKSKSLVHDYLVTIMGEENAKAYGVNEKGEEQIEGTDAQEFVTWQEHLYVLEKLGEIEPFTNLEGEEVTPEDIAEARKICESTKTFEQLNDSQVKLLTKLVQVMKPVYTGQVLKDGVMQVVYIKSSAIALIPQLTQGLEIDKLRLSMESFQSKYLTTQNGLQNTVRASFGTANKVGAVLNPVSMWNKDGSIKEMSMEDMEKAAIQLPRDNFRIQQSNPFKSGKKKKQDSVTIGSQERKLLFVNLLKLSNFEFQGTKYKGADLAKKYNDLYDNLFKINLSSLYEELGIDPTSNVPISKQVSVETLGKLLQKEAEERNYPIGDIRGLQIKDGKFVMPLWLHSSSDKYESLLNSIVSNRVIGIKLPGYSYVLGTEEGFKDKKIVEFDKVDESLKSKIVFTDSWEGELKPARFVLKSTGETITKSIDSYNPNEIELKPAQVIAPMKFRDAKGNLLNLLEKDSSGNYIYVKDTARGFRLNTGVFDKDTLRLFGFRIPTSGLMSMATIEIVGFTPLETGDTLIAPRDFTKQMGSDFDVDKIVAYMYNTIFKDGKLFRDDSTEEKKLQNDIIELHHTVLSHKSDYVQTQIHRPLSFDFAAEVASAIDDKRRGESKGMFTPLSTEYQKIKMMSGSSGKSGVGVYSLDVVFHANTQALNALGTPISLVSKEAGSYGLTIAGVKGHKNFGEEMTVTPSQVDIAIDYLKSIEQPTEVDKKFMELMVISKDSSSITQFKEQYPGVIEEGLADYRFISDVLAEAQNYSVDNEKEQIMGRINDNSITFNARKPLNMLGIDKSFTKVNTGKESKRMSIVNLFMTQTVLMDRVTPMMNSKNSTLATYDSSPLNSVAVEIMNELDKYKVSSDLSSSDLVASMSAQEMYDMIGLEFDAMTSRQLLLQKAILSKYIELDAIGTQINSIQTSINTDSKKLGKSLFENIATLEKVLKLPSKTVVVDAEKFTFTNAEKLIGEFRTTPFEGATQIVKGVYVKPTTVNGFATIYGLVTAIQMYEEVFPYTSKQFNEVANTLGNVLGKEETTTKLRQSLLKTLKSYAYANSSTQNLDKSIDETRAELFIDVENGNMSLAKFIKQAKEVYPKLDRYAVINSLKLEVESNGQPSILKWNNSVQVEFEDQFYLSFLAMLTDTTPIGIYNGKEMTIQSLAQNMITYSYLEGGIQLATQFIRHIPVEYLETYGITSKLNNFNVNSPEAYGIDTTRVKDESYIPDIIKQHVQHNPRQLPQLPQSFNEVEFIEAKEVKAVIKSTPPFVITFNPKLAVKGLRNSGITIFELTDSGYIPIPTLGVSNFNEFNMDKKGETQKSLVHKAPEKVEVKPKIESKADKKSIKYTYNLDQPSAREVLKVINNTLGNLFLETDTDFKLEIVPGYDYEAVYSNGIIKLSEGFLKDIEAGVKPYSYFERIMLEEFSHGLVREAIKNPTERGTELLKSITRYYNRARTKIIEKFGQETLDTLEARFKPGNSPTGITDEERSFIYGGINMIEFTGHLLTNSDFQNMLNEVTFEVDSQPQTFWSKIKDLLTNLLLDFINVPNLRENSLTTMAVADILELIGENRTKETSVEKPITKESKVETPVINTNLKSREYKLPNGKTIVFNDQQWEGLQKIESFLGDKSKQTFTLSGYAGTGKSTLIKKILDNYKGSVVVSAPTHKAVQIIGSTTEKVGVTLQSLLGLQPNYDIAEYSASNPQFAQKGEKKIKYHSLVIIDEASMINEGLYDLLVSEAEKAGTKIIFMGDIGQIPPIGEEVSKAFTEVDEIHQLTHVERTSKTNPLMLIFDAIRSNFKSKFDNFKHETSLNQEGEGVEFTEKKTLFQEKMLKYFKSPEFEKDNNYVKIITYTNDLAERWNNIIRGELIDSDNVVAKGDLLTGYRSILEGRDLLVQNSADYKVTKVVPKTKVHVHNGESYKLKGYETSFQSGQTVFIIDYLDKETEKNYLKIMYENTTYAKTFRKWDNYYAFADNFMSLQKYKVKGETIPRTFDYGYAVTAHKSQGSTYNKVGIIEDDMDGNKKTKERNQIKYVAFSRAKENVISLSSKEGQAIQREKIYDEAIEEDENIPDYNEKDMSDIKDLFSPKDFKVDEFKSTLSEADRKLFNRLKREGVIKTKCK